MQFGHNNPCTSLALPAMLFFATKIFEKDTYLPANTPVLITYAGTSITLIVASLHQLTYKFCHF
jgi:hypothetical protein